MESVARLGDWPCVWMPAGRADGVVTRRHPPAGGRPGADYVPGAHDRGPEGGRIGEFFDMGELVVG